MKNNLFISSNALTMVIFSWIIEKYCPNDNNILIIVTNHPELKFIRSMLMMAQNLGCFSKKLIFDTYAPTKLDTMEMTDEIEAFNMDWFRKDVGVDNFDNIYTTYFYRHSKFLVDKYPDAVVHFVENGTVSYFKQDVSIDIINRTKTFFTFNYFDLFFPADVKRFPHITNVKIDKQGAKDKFRLAAGTSEIPSDPNSIIVCAQNMSLNKALMSTEYEFIEYFQVVKKFLDMGLKVYFKDHPKTPDMFYKMIQSTIRSPNLILINNSAPIEIVASMIKPKAIVGVFTSSLLTVPHLYDIPAYCIMMRNNLSKFRIYEIAYAMIMSYIPLVDDYEKQIKFPCSNVAFLDNPLVNMLDMMYRHEIIDKRKYFSIHNNIDKIDKKFFEYFSTPTEMYKMFRKNSYKNCVSYLQQAYKKNI